MFCGKLISPEISPLGIRDTVAQATARMEELKLRHLPLAEAGSFLGMVAEDDLLDESVDIEIGDLQDVFKHAFVRSGDIFLLAVKQCLEMQTDIVPVLNDKKEYEGVITVETLFRELARMSGAGEYGSLVVLEMETNEYSLGEINRLVESNDAVITQLNTLQDPDSHLLTVVLRINKEEISDVIASFQRHEYNVRYYVGEELFRNELQSNLDHLLNYLNI